jgi:hypothetical protein
LSQSTRCSWSGALFCHDIKRASTRVEPITLNPGIDGKLIKIRPDPELGQPGQLAHKVFVALIKKHSDSHCSSRQRFFSCTKSADW